MWSMENREAWRDILYITSDDRLRRSESSISNVTNDGLGSNGPYYNIRSRKYVEFKMQ